MKPIDQIRRSLLLTLWLAIASAALAQSAAPMLIPFQGRVTDQQGIPRPNGTYTLIFNLYDQAVGGRNLWTERHENVGLINGMVNVFLGSIQPLDSPAPGVDFSSIRYLGITVDADNRPNTADPEMVPRQMIIPAFWAKHADNAARLNGKDWSSLLVSGNDPETSDIKGSKIQRGGITDAQMAANAIKSAQLADASVTTAKLDAQLRLDAIIPSGTIMAFGGVNVPNGWLLCDGSALSSSDVKYARLHRFIGTSWGNGIQSSAGARFPAITAGTIRTDFNLPDLRGAFLRGVNGERNGVWADPDASITGRINLFPGGNNGNQVGSFQQDAFAKHDHEIFPKNSGANPGEGNAMQGATTNAKLYGTSTTGERGGSTETRPKNAYVHYIIKD